MGRIWLVAVCLVLGICDSGTAEACSCTPRGASCGPPAEFWRAGAVFVGRVSALERVKPPGESFNRRRARVQIVERLRGALPAEGATVDVFTDAPSRCGYPFTTGQVYVIYAVRQDDGRMSTSACSRTSPLERADADLAYARQAAAGQVPPGRIVGEVRHATDHPGRWKAVAGFSVALTRNGTRLHAVTDARGRYSIEPPAAGTYTVDVSLPETEYTPQSGQAIELSDPRACVEANVDILFNGQVSGRVIDAEGRSVGGLTISYTRPGRAEGTRSDSTRILTRDDGSYLINRVPPGVFILAVELPEQGEDGDGAYTRAAFEKRATLRGGERLALDPLVLPSEVRITRLAGTVHSSDGFPALDARVFLKGAGEPSFILGAPATTDTLGRFVLAVLDGERYRVFAERAVPGGSTSSPEFSDPVTVDASPEQPPLRLTLRRRF